MSDVRSDQGPRPCQQVKADGTPCRANAQRASAFCFFHDPATKAERTAASRAGGIERSRRPAVLPPETADLPLGDSENVARLLGETINHVRRGELDPRIANAVGYLAGVLLRALEQGRLDDRVAVLEAAVLRQCHPGPSVLEEHEEVDFEFVEAKSA